MEKLNSQSKLLMLPTTNSFILMKSNHEYQTMEHFFAAWCQNVIPENKIE